MIPLGILSILRSIWDIWSRIPSPIKVALIVILAGFIGFNMGERKQIRICEAQKQESIQEAKRIDSEANASAIKRMQEQTDKYRNQALESENKLNEAKEYYATLPAFCKIDDDFLDRNNAIGVGPTEIEKPKKHK